jgi:hypothetical protein
MNTRNTMNLGGSAHQQRGHILQRETETDADRIYENE